MATGGGAGIATRPRMRVNSLWPGASRELPKADGTGVPPHIGAGGADCCGAALALGAEDGASEKFGVGGGTIPRDSLRLGAPKLPNDGVGQGKAAPAGADTRSSSRSSG